MPGTARIAAAAAVAVAAFALLLRAPTSREAPAGARSATVPGAAPPATVPGFARNDGQAPEGVRYTARAPGALLSIEDAAARVTTPGGEVRLAFAGASPAGPPQGEARLPGVLHDYRGEPARWRRNIPTFARVGQAALYPGVDLAWRLERGALEYDLVVAPGADPGAVRVAVEAPGPVAIDAEGRLTAEVAGGQVIQPRPVAWQEIDGARRPVEVAWRLDGAVASLALGPYDRSRELVVDPPVLSRLAFHGTANSDTILGAAAGANGELYVVGTMVANTPGSTAPTQDAFVSRLAPDGIPYSTALIGGLGADTAKAVAYDPAAGVAVVGTSDGAVFGMPPVAGGVGGADAWVALFDPALALTPSYNRLGGTGADVGEAVAFSPVDHAVWVAATIDGSVWPLARGGSFFLNNSLTGSSPPPGTNALVGRLDANLQPTDATFLGGAGNDTVHALAIDAAGRLHVAGSYDAAFLGASAPVGGLDAYVAKVRYDATTTPATFGLVWITSLGSAGSDEFLAMALDPTGLVAAAGYGSAAIAGVPGNAGGTDALLAVYDGTGVLQAAQYLGGTSADAFHAVQWVAGPTVSLAAVGQTASYWLGTADTPAPLLIGGEDGLVAQFALVAATAGTHPKELKPSWVTYLGGTGTDSANAVVPTPGGLWVAGGTSGPAGWVVPPAGVPAGAGLADGFLAFLSNLPKPTLTAVNPSHGPIAGGTPIVISGTFDAPTAMAPKVFLDGVAVTVNASTSSTSVLRATTAAHAPGAVDLVVENADGQRAVWVGGYTFDLPPAIGSLAPTGGPLAGGNTVTIHGSGFATPTVTFGGTAAAVVSWTADTIAVTAPARAALGAVAVIVTNADGQVSQAGSYTYATPPSATSMLPDHGPASGGTQVVITGSGFDAPSVTFAGIGASVVSSTATVVVATAPAATSHAAGTATVRITNGDGQYAELPTRYTWDALPPPAIDGIAPASGPSAGGIAVTLTGSGFDAPVVLFGGTQATPSAASATSLTVTTPAHLAGAVAVEVRNLDGQTALLPDGFAFEAGGTGGSAGGGPGRGDRDPFSCGNAASGPSLLAGLAALLLRRRRRPEARTLLLCLGLLLPALAAAAPPSPKPLRVAVLPLRGGIGVDPRLAEAVTDLLVAATAHRPGLQVVSLRDVEAAIGLERKRAILGCAEDGSCLAEIAGSLGVERVVTGSLARVGETTVFTATVVDARKGTAERRYQGRIRGAEDALLDAAEKAALELFPPPAAAAPGARAATAVPLPPPPVLRTSPAPAAATASTEVGLRGAYAVEGGGAGALLLTRRTGERLSLSAGFLYGAGKAPGGLLRCAVTVVNPGGRVRGYAALEAVGLSHDAFLLGAAAGAGLEISLGPATALALEVPYLRFFKAPSDYRKGYLLPSLALSVRL